MNARTTTLLIVLALALAACMVPIQAPPPRVQQPALPERTLPIEQAPAQSQTPATQVTEPTTAQDAALLAAQKQLVSQLMVGVPPQAQSYIETYAAIEVARQSQQPADTLATKIAMIEHYAVGAPAEVQVAIRDYIDSLTLPASQMPARDQWYLEDRTATPVLPELTATVPKSREVQAMDDMLKPEVLPAETTAAKIATLEQAAQTVPPQVREAINEYIDTLKMPASLPAESTAAEIATLEQAAQTVPPQVREAIYEYIDTLKMPASQMPVRDQWYLDQ